MRSLELRRGLLSGRGGRFHTERGAVVFAVLSCAPLFGMFDVFGVVGVLDMFGVVGVVVVVDVVDVFEFSSIVGSDCLPPVSNNSSSSSSSAISAQETPRCSSVFGRNEPSVLCMVIELIIKIATHNLDTCIPINVYAIFQILTLFKKRAVQ